MSDSVHETHLQELRRGTVVLACLRLLTRPDYGYALLEELNGRGFDTDANTLYPLLRRLEKQGHLVSEWNTDEVRPRKFYRTSPAGTRLAATLTDDFHTIAQAIDLLPTTEPKGRRP
ncbi:PadR family transcriptional regulator [Micropruina sonneratiae]|uniref:PadR family transcriptional regulator n=1 Tax=Micropruina sonneratiae TaxID=2986940 RepID=UPI002227EDA6|nr:PadR family transcriptional regulator [Micropruina sp. KQZ13P-5]MCW3157744.1 PadR family transcriptional regulator [Micropruina sp. KQZ13P-5]